MRFNMRRARDVRTTASAMGRGGYLTMLSRPVCHHYPVFAVLRSAGHGNPHHRFDLINPAILRAARSQRSRGFNDPWLRDLLARRPFKVAAVAYAAKLARMIWAMLVTGECYRVRDRSAPKPVAA
jgi:hypothetical protein